MNMSYCRYQNTYADLCDCARDLESRMSDPEDHEPLSDAESGAREELFETMATMLQQLGVDVDMHEVHKALKEIK